MEYDFIVRCHTGLLDHFDKIIMKTRTYMANHSEKRSVLNQMMLTKVILVHLMCALYGKLI